MNTEERARRDARIRELRALGWTLARIGADVGLSASMVGRVLNPAPYQARALAYRPKKKRYDHDRYAADPKAAYERNHPAAVRAAHRYQAESLETAVNNGKVWTDAELEVLSRRDLTGREMARLLGRTVSAVWSMKGRLKSG